MNIYARIFGGFIALLCIAVVAIISYTMAMTDSNAGGYMGVAIPTFMAFGAFVIGFIIGAEPESCYSVEAHETTSRVNETLRIRCLELHRALHDERTRHYQTANALQGKCQELHNELDAYQVAGRPSRTVAVSVPHSVPA